MRKSMFNVNLIIYYINYIFSTNVADFRAGLLDNGFSRVSIPTNNSPIIKSYNDSVFYANPF